MAMKHDIYATGIEDWSELLTRAEVSLDEQGQEQYEKWKRVAAKKIARAESRGQRVKLDMRKVHAVMLRFGKGERYLDAVKAVGIGRDDMMMAMDLHPEVKIVCEYVNRRRKEEEDLTDGDIANQARVALKDIIVNGDDSKRTVATTFALERLDRKKFGKESEEVREAGVAGNRTVYKIENMNVMMVGGKGVVGSVGVERPEGLELEIGEGVESV